MKRIILLLIVSMLMAGSVLAECLFTIEDFRVTPDQIGTEIALTVKAEFSARVSSWQVDFTYPEGLTPTRAEAGSDYGISYINAYGHTAMYDPSFYYTTNYSRFIGYTMDAGYWYDPDTENLTSYGIIKWEGGTYEEMFILYVEVTDEFQGGQIIMTTECASSRDERGGTIRENGDNAVVFTHECNVTLMGGIEAYACYTSSNTTLTFYYDKQRSSRTGTTYDLNYDPGYGSSMPDWYDWDGDGIGANVTKVVFDPSFGAARPTTTYGWFSGMWNLASVTGMKEYLNTTEVINMSYMFDGCTELASLDLSGFSTSKVERAFHMFYYCRSLTSLDLSSFNTSRVTLMDGMFSGCNNLRTIYVGNGWNTAAVTSSSDMFYNCTSLVGGMGTTYDANHIDKAYAHIDGGTSNPGYFTEKGPEAYACYTPFNTTLTFYCDYQRSSRTGSTYDLNYDSGSGSGSSVPDWYDWDGDGIGANVTKVVFDPSFAAARPTTTYGWFSGMWNLTSVTGMKEYLNTTEVINMTYMFDGCTELASLDLSGFSTSKVERAFHMFYYCTSLTSLDLSSFNTAKMISMVGMFSGCNNLRTIYVGNGWNTAAVTSSSDMFYNCTSLVGGMGTTYDANHVDKTYAHIDGGPSNPGYFTAKNAGLRGDVNHDGQVNITDVTTLISMIMSDNTSGNPEADVNSDGNVNITDVTTLITMVMGS